MDKKIILSVLIVALIGIVAATYQINPGQEILNPLASVDTEEPHVTEVLTAPEESQKQAQDQANAQAKQQAQAQAQAQQAQDQANAQAQQQAQDENSQSDSSLAGSTSQSSIINANNPVTIADSAASDSSSGSSDSASSSSDANVATSDSSSAASGNTSSNGDSSTGTSTGSGSDSGSTDSNSGATDSGSTSTDSGSSSNTSSDSGSSTPVGDEIVSGDSSSVDDKTWSEIDSVVQGAKGDFAFGIYADRESCSVDENGLYSVKLYNAQSNALVGTLFVNIDKNSAEYGQWYLIDVNGDYQGKDVNPNV